MFPELKDSMIIDIILSIIFLILLGLTIIKGRYTKSGIGETPLIYRSEFIQFILTISMLALFVLSIFLLFFYSWKLFLLLSAIGFVTEVFIIVPLIEKVSYFIVKTLLFRKCGLEKQQDELQDK